MPPPPHVMIRRADRPGDLGWVVLAHGEIYHREYGWSTAFEALIARIVADYAAGHDPHREAAWIAEVDGARAGCVCVVAGEDPAVARLRVLLVTPAARGLGLGSRLVGECVQFARDSGYTAVTLWTVDILTSARRIYEGFGFTLTAEEPHHAFGHPLTGQTWTLHLP